MKPVSKIAVLGLGYVGLPLAVALARHFRVTGYDLDSSRVSEIRAGHDRTREVSAAALTDSALVLTDKVEDLKEAEFFIVAVPTPVDETNRPDLAALRSASRQVGSVLTKGAVVVYESTVYPGVTEAVCGPILEEASGLRCGIDFYLGYSPERINPGDREHSLERITKVVAGQTPEVSVLLKEVYGKLNDGNIFVAHALKAVPNPLEHNPAIPHKIVEAILRCLEKKPDDRYDNCGRISLEIKNALFEDVLSSPPKAATPE